MTDQVCRFTREWWHRCRVFVDGLCVSERAARRVDEVQRLQPPVRPQQLSLPGKDRAAGES